MGGLSGTSSRGLMVVSRTVSCEFVMPTPLPVVSFQMNAHI